MSMFPDVRCANLTSRDTFPDQIFSAAASFPTDLSSRGCSWDKITPEAPRSHQDFGNRPVKGCMRRNYGGEHFAISAELFEFSEMQNKILGLRTCIYRVPDMDAAVSWYSTAFSATPYFNEPFYAGFNIGGYELGLQPRENNDTPGTTVLAYWGVNDVEAAVEYFVSLGASVFESPQHVGGDIVVAAVKDPWGNTIGLIRNPSFSVAGPPVH